MKRAIPLSTAPTSESLWRTISTIAADGSTTSDSYSGKMVTVTDPAGKWKKFTMDAFGNLTRVDEPGAATITTFYTYDVLNHLTQVAMWTLHATQYRIIDLKACRVSPELDHP